MSAMSRASSTTRVFRSAEKAHPTIRRDQCVENDRKVDKAGQRGQEGDVGHPQPVRLLGHEVAGRIAGGMTWSVACRVVIGAASAPADARDPLPLSHQPSRDPLPANIERPSAFSSA